MSVLLGPGLSSRIVRVPREEVAWVRYVLEAHDGLANLYGDGTDVITLVTPTCNETELDGVLVDLGLIPLGSTDVGARPGGGPPPDCNITG